MTSSEIINVGVIGAGAFGRNHARVYHQLAQEGQGVRLAGVVDSDLARAEAVAKEYGASAFRTTEELIQQAGKIDAASVAVPTVHHLPVARALMEAGVDVLIEKPLAPSLAEADELISLAQANG